MFLLNWFYDLLANLGLKLLLNNILIIIISIFIIIILINFKKKTHDSFIHRSPEQKCKNSVFGVGQCGKDHVVAHVEE